eukprot:1950346-Amphidinium_carterae.1
MSIHRTYALRLRCTHILRPCTSPWGKCLVSSHRSSTEMNASVPCSDLGEVIKYKPLRQH